MSEEQFVGECKACGRPVQWHDGERTTTCDCDPWCEVCGRRFVRSRVTPRRLACDACVEREIRDRFSRNFLISLSEDQRALLTVDVRSYHSTKVVEP